MPTRINKHGKGMWCIKKDEKWFMFPFVPKITIILRWKCKMEILENVILYVEFKVYFGKIFIS